MIDYKSMSTPMMPKTKGCASTSSFSDPTPYHSLVNALQYLTLTQPDLSYIVIFVFQFFHSLTVSHFKLVKFILRYMKGKLAFDFHFN